MAEAVTIEKLVKEIIPEERIEEIDVKSVEKELNSLLGELVVFLNEKKDEGISEGNIERALASELLKKKLHSNCVVVRRKSPYREFLRECIPARLSEHSLQGTQEAMIECAGIWRNMPEQDRKKYEKNGYELAVFC